MMELPWKFSDVIPTTNSATCALTDGKITFGDRCTYSFCPVCEYEENSKDFQLRGVCLDSNVDTFYIFVNTSYMLGYINSEIVYNTEKIQWEIRNTRTGNISAVMNDTVKFPIGLNKWYFLESHCKEADRDYRLLRLHLDVPEPGYFCCDDGYCDRSQYVCDDFPNCENAEDENNCMLISNPINKK